jgi:hypothetical protein
MAASNLLALIDDIATILDDIALMSKLAAKKTAGVLGDDLALNAQQVSGVRADRELPVVWAVGVGSFKNKLILVPAALAISAIVPWAVTPLLMVGGAYLCYEGFEKLAHKFGPGNAANHEGHAERVEALINPAVDMRALEKDKIRGAIRTDFILSAEIIVIALGTVAHQSFGLQVAVLSLIAIAMTIGVYGLVACIVKLDDLGLYLSRSRGAAWHHALRRGIGELVLSSAPFLMKGLSAAGMAAMFLVGGGIITHGIPWLSDLGHRLAIGAAALPLVGGLLAAATPMLLSALAGILVGALVLAAVLAAGGARRAFSRGAGPPRT